MKHKTGQLVHWLDLSTIDQHCKQKMIHFHRSIFKHQQTRYVQVRDKNFAIKFIFYQLLHKSFSSKSALTSDQWNALWEFQAVVKRWANAHYLDRSFFRLNSNFVLVSYDKALSYFIRWLSIAFCKFDVDSCEVITCHSCHWKPMRMTKLQMTSTLTRPFKRSGSAILYILFSINAEVLVIFNRE